MAPKKGDKGGKKPHKNQLTSKKYEMFKVSGNSVSKNRHCPRCGPGVYLASHKGRLYCGKCHYTEFMDKVEAS